MTILPHTFHFPSALLRLPSPSLFTNPIFLSMAAQTHYDSQETNLPNAPNCTINYPVPLSPPLPAISKQMELARALSASSKSSLFSLSRTDLVFEDDWLIAVNKPRGVYCESVLSSIPSLLNDSNDSVELGTQVDLPELHLANRLDRDTSGVMLITKSHKVAAKLVRAFTDHKVRKTYIAFCVGQAPKWRQITIKSGHGRSKFGAWRVYAASDVGRKLPGGSVVRDMQTLFEVLSVNGHGCSKELTAEEKIVVVEGKSVVDTNNVEDEVLVRAYPQSGRTHQIRLHCQYLGIPIRGDVKYEGVYEWKGIKYDGHELHAESLSFEHPITGLPVVIDAPLPMWAIQALQPLPC
ncbi:hypothetical protein RHSIM_Rhsim05G0132300 [Rhododendron simsii]|uniref:Pseudouridine synthase RsuA/RluA-like domain-containing protein n=1 Tax=Rhododendron simsii TaxID=118357 RepID=A0A834LKL3_RHOSS|nr:hypothetical protein RHSIM_Rhsim05G0132300 [Rhododendron simsii]